MSENKNPTFHAFLEHEIKKIKQTGILPDYIKIGQPKAIEEKMTAGGKRPGAGRKPRETPRETISVKIEPEHAEKFRAICKARGRSQSEQITEFIKRARL